MPWLELMAKGAFFMNHKQMTEKQKPCLVYISIFFLYNISCASSIDFIVALDYMCV
jgi:hypothetical protein